MSILFYHKNLKPFGESKITEEKDLDYYRKVGAKLILDGFKSGYNITTQVEIYREVIKTYQNIKLYKLSDSDKDYYVTCILALWKLDIIDPDNPEDPFFIAPSYKRRI